MKKFNCSECGAGPVIDTRPVVPNEMCSACDVEAAHLAATDPTAKFKADPISFLKATQPELFSEVIT